MSQSEKPSIEERFPWPIFDEADVQAVVDLLKTGEWGQPDCEGYVRTFEEEFARVHDSKFGVAVVNGSVAIRLALLASGVQQGDEVIVPPYTFYATPAVVVECNCVPVFADIEQDTYCIDPDCIEKLITEKTRAIVPVHFGGQAANMQRIMQIAEKHGLAVIEDACHAHGAEYKGRKLGSIGHAGCFSFQSSKNLTAGEGGIITSNDEALYDTMNSLRNCGRIKDQPWYFHGSLGCNYRITQIQAVMLLGQLRRLEQQTKTRNENGLYLNQLLEKIDGIRPLTRGHGETLHSYHLYIFRYDKAKCGGLCKEDFVDNLVAEGVPAFMGYPEPLYRQPVFIEKNFYSYYASQDIDYTKVRCPVCERACYEEAVWITQNGMLGDRTDMECFAQAIEKIQQQAR